MLLKLMKSFTYFFKCFHVLSDRKCSTYFFKCFHVLSDRQFYCIVNSVNLQMGTCFMKTLHAGWASRPIVSFIFLQVPWNVIRISDTKHCEKFKISFSVTTVLCKIRFFSIWVNIEINSCHIIEYVLSDWFVKFKRCRNRGWLFDVIRLS